MSTDEDDEYWQPGQTIPPALFVPDSPIVDQEPPRRSSMPNRQPEITEPSNTFLSILQGFQSSMEMKMEAVAANLASINNRMDSLGENQKVLESQVSQVNSSLMSSATSTSISDSPLPHNTKKRGRQTPISLQVSLIY